MQSRRFLLITFLVLICGAIPSAEPAGASDRRTNYCIIPSIDDDNLPQREADFREANNLDGAGIFASVPIPQLSSKPGAQVTIFLDFDGHPAHNWAGLYNVPVTPPYDQDGDSTAFVQAEIDSIVQIWKRVAESYSPFAVNVTTVEPASLPANQAFKIIIGGNNTWLGGGGGVAVLSLFAYPTFTRWGFCFDKNLSNGHPKYTADCVAHEAGHILSLDHQSLYSGTTKQSEYHPGDGEIAPIMGVAYSSTRGIWWLGATPSGSTVIQDDIPQMLGMGNFVVAGDDTGSAQPLASALDQTGLNLSGAGIIERLDDVDVFSFGSGAGTVTLNVNSFTPGGTLDVKAVLKDSSGNVLDTDQPGNSLSAGVSANVADGIYYLYVSSQAANPGDLGRYNITGTIPAAFNGTLPTPVATATPTGNPGGEPTPVPTAVPTLEPTPLPLARLEILNPLAGDVLSRSVTVRIRTRQVDQVRVTEKQGRSWRARIRNSGEATSQVRYKMNGKASDLKIRAYLSNQQVAVQSMKLRLGKQYFPSKQR